MFNFRLSYIMNMGDKNIYLLIGIILLILSLSLSFFYRPFIYNNNINDYGFADTIGSLFSVIVFCTIVWGLKEYSNKEKNKQIVLATITYAFLWELGLFPYLRHL